MHGEENGTTIFFFPRNSSMLKAWVIKPHLQTRNAIYSSLINNVVF
jgi:hypothetical protein